MIKNFTYLVLKMKDLPNHSCHYLHISETDEKWGLVCTTAGMQDVPAGSIYPIDKHPENYSFKFEGRILYEYQLVYIVEGEGVFKSASCEETHITAGTIILLFPGEWHYYAPIKDVGWKEYWVGFKGPIPDKLKEGGFFTPENPIMAIGYSASIESCYTEIIATAYKEQSGFQILISSIVMHILGSIYYKSMALMYREDTAVSIINSAREYMRNNIDKDISITEVIDKMCVGYSWFRHKFKEYVGSSPSQYLLMLKFNKAKDMLASDTAIKDIAYSLGFESISQFSNFFKRYAGESPRQYRQKRFSKFMI